jgi:hypothetical protein
VKNRLERMWKETTVYKIKYVVLSQHLSGGSEERISVRTASLRPRLETATFRIRSRSVNHSVVPFDCKETLGRSVNKRNA